MILQEELRCKARHQLLDIVQHDEAAGPHDAGRAQQVEKRKFELMAAVDQHHVIEKAPPDRLIKMCRGVHGKKRYALSNLLRQRRDQRWASLSAERVDGFDMTMPSLPQSSRHDFGRAGAMRAYFQHQFGALHDNQMMKQRSRVVALQRLCRVVFIRCDDAFEGLGFPPSR
jgi:hypothetical protein